MEAGLVLLTTVSTDGTKILARASKKSLFDAKRVDKVSEAIDRIFREADEADRRDDERYGEASGDSMPPELADATKRKEKLREIAERLKESGRKSVSATDEDCRVMKTTSGLRLAYNVQMTVDSANMVIVAADVTNAETDSGQLAGQLDKVEENTGRKAQMVLADKGYSDEGTFERLSATGQEALIPPKEQPQQKDRNNLFASRCFLRDRETDVLVCPAGKELTHRRQVKCSSGRYRVYTAECCRDCSFYKECVKVACKSGRSVQVSIVADEREAMIRRLRTPEGREQYSLRQQTVEPVFGNIKGNMGFARFGLHGKEGAMSETWLMCIAHNLKVLIARTGPAFLARFASHLIALLSEQIPRPIELSLTPITA